MLIAIPYGDVGILVNQASFVNDDGYYYAILCFHCAVYTKVNAEFAVTLRNAQERPSSKVRQSAQFTMLGAVSSRSWIVERTPSSSSSRRSASLSADSSSPRNDRPVQSRWPAGSAPLPL